MFDVTTIRENKAELQKAADKVAAATPKTPTGFLKLAWGAVYPFLPMLLTAFAPAIIKSKKSVAILRKADEVIDGILSQVPEE